MARSKNKTVSVSSAFSIDDLSMDDLLAETLETIKEKPKSVYGFYLPLNDIQNLAEKVLTILEGKDVPFALLGNIAQKAIAPVIGESSEARKVSLDSFVGSLWADIRKGAANTELSEAGKVVCKSPGNPVGRKVSCKEREGVVGDWLHLYVPRKREAGEETTEE